MIDLATYGVDVAALEQGAADALVPQLQALLGGAVGDVREIGLRIVQNGVRARLAGDHAWTAETDAQVRGLVELERVGASGINWDAVRGVAKLAVEAALQGAASAVPGGALASALVGAIAKGAKL